MLPVLASLLLCGSLTCSSPGTSGGAREPSAPQSAAAEVDAAPESAAPEAEIVEGDGPSSPEALGTAVRFPASWRGPCQIRDSYGGTEQIERFEYGRPMECLVPIFAALNGVFGCPTSRGLADDPPERWQEISYDDEGRMTSDGVSTYRWNGTTLIGMEGSLGPEEVSMNVIEGEPTLRYVELRRRGALHREVRLDEAGFPSLSRSLNPVTGAESSASTFNYESGRLVRIELAFPAMRHTIEVDYCD